MGWGGGVKEPLQSHLPSPKCSIYVEETDIRLTLHMELVLWSCPCKDARGSSDTAYSPPGRQVRTMSLICYVHHMQHCSDATPGSGGGGEH